MVLERTIGMTVTGEIFQPVRLYYSVFNRKKIENCLDSLRCIEFDAPRKRWVWIYEEEAKFINFKVKFSSLPENINQVIIGSFVWKDNNNLILDLRSYERALEAIKFFDKKIPRSVAKVTHCSTVNKIFEVNESAVTNFDVFFENNDKLVEIKPEDFIDRIKEKPLSANGNPDFQAITSFLDNEMDRFFEVEKFPIHFYDNGIKSLKVSFILRRTIAMERWNGAVNYSFKDVLKKIFNIAW
jgi:hypothetical protein